MKQLCFKFCQKWKTENSRTWLDSIAEFLSFAVAYFWGCILSTYSSDLLTPAIYITTNTPSDNIITFAFTAVCGCEHQGPFIHSVSANASNGNTNANATFERFCHSNKARYRTRKPVNWFLGGSSFTCLRYKIWSLGIMAQV